MQNKMNQMLEIRSLALKKNVTYHMPFLEIFSWPLYLKDQV